MIPRNQSINHQLDTRLSVCLTLSNSVHEQRANVLLDFITVSCSQSKGQEEKLVGQSPHQSSGLSKL